MPPRVVELLGHVAERQSKAMAKVRGLWGRHVQRNAEEMQRAAELALSLSPAEPELLILGFGAGNDVPAALLRDARFARVRLVDIDAEAMRDGLERQGLAGQIGGRIELVAADVSLLTPEFYAALDRVLDRILDDAHARESLGDFLASRALDGEPVPFFVEGLQEVGAGRGHLVVSTMLLTQMGYYLRSAVELRIAERLGMAEADAPALGDLRAMQDLIVELNDRHLRLFDSLRDPRGVGYLASDTGVLVPDNLTANSVVVDGQAYRPPLSEFIADLNAGLRGMIGAGPRQPGRGALETVARPLSESSVYRPALRTHSLPEFVAGMADPPGVAWAAAWSWQLSKERLLLVNALFLVAPELVPTARLSLEPSEVRGAPTRAAVAAPSAAPLPQGCVESTDALCELLDGQVDRQALVHRERLRELKSWFRTEPDAAASELRERLAAAGDGGFEIAAPVLQDLGIGSGSRSNKRARERLAQLMLLLRRAQGDAADDGATLASHIRTYREYLARMDSAYELKISSEGGAAEPAAAQAALDAIEAAKEPADAALVALEQLDPKTVASVRALEVQMDEATLPLRQDPTKLVAVLRSVRSLLGEGIALLDARLERLAREA